METTTATATNFPGAGSWTDLYWTVIVYLFVVAAFIAGLLFIRKYLIKRLGGVKNGVYIKIADRLVIAQDKQIILLEAGNKILVVGIGPQKMETLAEFSKEEFGDISLSGDGTGQDGGSGSFGGNFLTLLRKKLNLKDSGEKNEK